MGPGNARLCNFPIFRESFRSVRGIVRDLEKIVLADVPAERIQNLARTIWSVIDALRVGIGETKIVSGSKALHHVLPALVRPIDREYTLRFFYNHKNLSRGDETTFVEIFPYFRRIMLSCRSDIDSLLGAGMNTSATKVADNAIVGYVLAKLKPQVGKQ